MNSEAISWVALRHWKLIASLAFLFGGIGLILGLVLPPAYEAEAVLFSADEQNSGSGLGAVANQLGGVAALAGIKVGGARGEPEENLEFLKSRALLGSFLAGPEIIPVLFADRWDARSKQWKSSDVALTPSAQIRYFKQRVYNVSQDKTSGAIHLSVVWKDPATAAVWANSIVALANQLLRERAIKNSGATLNFLREQAQRAPEVEVRAVLFKLAEEQLKTIALATVHKDYAFRIIDPAMIPDRSERVRPPRVLLLVAGVLLGLVLGIAYARSMTTKRLVSSEPR